MSFLWLFGVATACVCSGREPGVARRATHFLLLRQKKVSKEKATLSLRPLRFAAGQTCAARRGWGTEQPNSHTGRRCARPRMGRAGLLATRGACARELGPSEVKARMDVRSPSPLYAPRSAGRGAACAEGHTLRGLTRCGCLSGAPQARSEFRSAPHARAPQVAPERSAGDADSGVAFSLVTFFWRAKRKLLARRATPGPRPLPTHAVAIARPCIAITSPNGWSAGIKRLLKPPTPCAQAPPPAASGP